MICIYIIAHQGLLASDLQKENDKVHKKWVK
jgi:hypothetical protein